MTFRERNHIMFDVSNLPTPCYIIDEGLLVKNLEKIKSVLDATNDANRVCKILLAQKAFSAFSLYPLIAEYLDGTTASSLFEAKLGAEYFRTPAKSVCDFVGKRSNNGICEIFGRFLYENEQSEVCCDGGASSKRQTARNLLKIMDVIIDFSIIYLGGNGNESTTISQTNL